MTDIDQSVRVRAAIEERTWLILLALIVLALFAGWWAYQVHAVPEFEQQETVIEQWSEETTFHHEAEIINDSNVWDPGDIVENRPIYYINLSDELRGNLSYSYSAADGDLTVTSHATLIIQAIDSLDNIDDPFWRVSEPVGEASDTGLGPDDSHHVEFGVDVRHVLETIETIERQLGAREGLVDVRVKVYTEVEGEVEGQAHDAVYESDLSMVVNPDTFRVVELETVSEEHTESEFTEVPVEPSAFEEYGSLGAFIILLAMMLVHLLAISTGQFEITKEERELLRLDKQREEFDDWITVGTFPAERDYESTILVDDLIGLVDVAIDTNNRVIEDPELGVSAVLDDNFVYIYVHPNSPARDWLVNYADVTMDEFQRG